MVKNPHAHTGAARDIGLIPRFCLWVRKIPWKTKWQPTPVSCLVNESHGQKSLVSYSPQGHIESDTN